MSFVDQADTLRAKAHLSGVRLPLLVGLSTLVLGVCIFSGFSIYKVFSSNSFVVEKVEEVEEEVLTPLDVEEEVVYETIYIHIGGAVETPGVYEVIEGSRVQDVVFAAGGFREDASQEALNLARAVSDGEYILVPTLDEVEDLGGLEAVISEEVTQSVSTTLININTATAEELDTLPGVGPSIAAKIVAEREENGLFESLEDLKRVSGIGDVTYAELVDLICVG